MAAHGEDKPELQIRRGTDKGALKTSETTVNLSGGDIMSREWAKDNLIRSANEHETICEKLRQIYDILHDMSNTQNKHIIVEKLIDALLMAKRMQSRLEYYKNTILFSNQNNSKNGGMNLKPVNNYKEIKEFRRKRIITEAS